MDIRFGFPGEHEVQDFLRRITMLVDHRATFEVHVGFCLVDSPSHNCRVNQQNYALGIRGWKQIQVHLHQIVNQWEIVFDFQDNFWALVGQNRRITVWALRLWDDQVDFCFAVITRIVKYIRNGQSYTILDLIMKVFLVEIVQLHLRTK